MTEKNKIAHGNNNNKIGNKKSHRDRNKRLG